MNNIRLAAEACYEEIVAIRRDIHRHPETGRVEFRTSAIIKEKLAEYGVDAIETPCCTAVVGIIKGALGEGKCVALRADIDALPVQEETELPYASEIPGVMHACCHDMHTAMLLGVAKVLCSMRDSFRGTVKLIFQHSEDLMPGGAKELVESGVMENPHVDAIFGMHIFPDQERFGKLALHSGPLTTSCDIFNVKVTGRGGHSSTPHLTKDPILAACQMVVLLQQIQSRYTNPLETAIFPIGSIHSGDAPNVIPDVAVFSGGARAYLPSVREEIKNQLFEIAKGVEILSGCKVEISYVEGYPPCFNDAQMVDVVRRAAKESLGEESIIELEEPFSFSEDFSYYRTLTGVPSAFFGLYAGNVGSFGGLHNPKCAVQEEAMPYGITAMAAAAVEFLK